ncbi:hypothetical protein BD289DRAFT_360066 [Coniella lustricola]|uniref:F-box domain-containing protein n=1 Tax=Coniella lustricola TaxID=2025994 RepID=A0A2T3AK94_9PEZI|nr:hypothetical protein BD289DRAFT_360066 [Coniella lustricola]
MSMEADNAIEAAQSPQPLHFYRLPGEIQAQIITECSPLDLICVALVSKHFRDLAAAELYRNLEMLVTDEDDLAFETIDSLSKCLETFATSDYDYAKHVRSILLDTVFRGEKAEAAYKLTLGSRATGNFLNTLLLLMLRKTKALEEFTWGIRVELSRPVYEALHQIKTLTHLHIRLQHGMSGYEAPPPLPLYTPTISPSASTTHLPSHNQILVAPPGFYLPPPSNIFGMHGIHHAQIPQAPPPVMQPKVVLQHKARASRKPAAATSPPTLSGFKNLSSLEILDIDSLEVVTELKSCIRNSQSTLKDLKLSFSTNLAMRARKPPPEEVEPDDSDPEDDFQLVPVTVPPPPAFDDISIPAKAVRAQEERKTQESVLGRIFDLEPYMVKEPIKQAREKAPELSHLEEKATTDPGRDFINQLSAVSSKLMTKLNGSQSLTAHQQDILDLIEAAARKYVAAIPASKEGEGEEPQTNKTPAKSESNRSGPHAEGGSDSEADDQQAEPSLFTSSISRTKVNATEFKPEDIDVEAPIDDALPDDTADLDSEVANETASPSPEEPVAKTSGAAESIKDDKAPAEDLSPGVSSLVANLEAQLENFKMLAKKLQFYEIQVEELQKEINELLSAGPDAVKRIKDAEKQTSEFSNCIKEIRDEMSIVAAEIDDVEKQQPDDMRGTKSDAVRQRIYEYTRSTRGLSLEALSIYLIPVKPSVLSRAIDLHVLRSVTLLGVGVQAPIWALFAKKNKLNPLPLRTVFTDNVSLDLLTFLSQLSELHELFLFERSRKFKPEPFASSSIVTLGQIRRLVLKKHLSTLKRLMIKCQAGWQWDVDRKTALLLCRKGGKLEELAISIGLRDIHTLLQNIQHLTSLRALHIVNLRNDDGYVSLMRETKRFIIDTLTHCHRLKLEWLAIDEDDTVEHIVRWKVRSKGGNKDRHNSPLPSLSSYSSKGKEKEVDKSSSGGEGSGASGSGSTTTGTPSLQSAAASNNNINNSNSNNGNPYPVFSLHGSVVGSDSEDDDIGSRSAPAGTVMVETDIMPFYEAWDVKIFSKEVALGHL